jgi:RND superfamily putative drug exporter
MLTRLATTVVRRRVAVLVLTLVALVLAGAYGGGVATRLSSGGFDDPAAESIAAENVLTEQFGSGQPNVVLLVTARSGAVDEAAAARSGAALTAELAAEEGIATAVSYWSLGSPPPLRSTDGRQALVLARIDGDEDAVTERIEHLSPRYTRSDAAIDVRVGGQAEVFRQIGGTVESDLKRAELFAVPITMVLLVLVFGSVVAASLPLLIGAVRRPRHVRRTAPGAALHRRLDLQPQPDHRARARPGDRLQPVRRQPLPRGAGRPGRPVHDAVVESVRTAGAPVAFSALTVAVSLAALLVFPLYFLRSFAYAGIAVVTLAGRRRGRRAPGAARSPRTRVEPWRLWRPRRTARGRPRVLAPGRPSP